MICKKCNRSKGHALGCPNLTTMFETARDDMRAEQVLRIAEAANMPIEDVAICGPEFLALADVVVRDGATRVRRKQLASAEG